MTSRRIDVADAERLILEHMQPAPAATVPLAEATGGVLRQNVRAERDQPPFDRATMDGIAVASNALASGRREFRLAGTQAAGAPELRLNDEADCLEIMTGAVMPTGSDTVIPVERITQTGDTVRIEADYDASPRQFVHPRGSDHSHNEILLKSGTVIGGVEMAILTAAGAADVDIAVRPSVAVVSTGDELVDVGEPILPHQIRSSNDRAIEAALALRGIRDVVRARLPDDRDALFREIGNLHAAHDILVLSGGVSMGKFDYVPAILEQLGIELVFHKILQRPGLPMWFGVSRDDKPVFALPGNPVSTLVCLSRYVTPAIEVALGAPVLRRPVRLAEDVEFAPDLTWLLPVRLRRGPDGDVAVPCPTNTSGDFVGLRGTAGFVELPRGRDRFPAGYETVFYRW